MDSYYLGKEDWDSFVELGVDQMKDELILKKIPTAVKSAFTRQYVDLPHTTRYADCPRYNKKDHPIAFHKGDMFAASKKKLVETGPAPDNDDVFEVRNAYTEGLSVADWFRTTAWSRNQIQRSRGRTTTLMT
jgi:replication factor C subunit 1